MFSQNDNPCDFAELLGRSGFSWLEGSSHPEQLVERAAELGLTAIALCDRDGLYGSVRMHAAAKELQQKVIVGAELSLERPGSFLANPAKASTKAVEPDRNARPSVALLVESQQGYAALCRLLTAAHRDHEKGQAGITVEQIVTDSAELFALVPLDPRCLLNHGELALLREAFADRCAIATWRHLEPDDRPRLELARELGKRFDLPIVASARPLYHHRSHKALADVLACIRHKTTLEQAGQLLRLNAEAELRSAIRMARLFPQEPAFLQRSVQIAERCQFSLDQLRYSFPSEYCDDGLDPDQTLRLRVERGCLERYPHGVPERVRRQLDTELELIAELDVASYFLSVDEIVELARSRHILCQGRGSAANSAVCFVLGITSVDPARSATLFERFMSAERHEPPDIDVDFEHERREEVIQAIYERYGRDRAAMVSEVITYRAKSAVREVGKVFALSKDQLERLSSIVSYFSPEPSEQQRDGPAWAVGKLSARALAKRGLDPQDVRLQQVAELAAQLQGLPRHLSVHVGGFVLSAEPLYLVAPIEPARMPDRTVIPWDKDDLDALGFFKIDVLGLGMLTAIRKALELVHGYQGRIDAAAPDEPFEPLSAFAAIPPEDPVIYDAVCEADTVGVFQIESRAQMSMLPLLRPRCFYDLVIEVGIVRPGPIQGKMVHPYLRRRTGEQPIDYPHPCLQPILERTLGVPLFQEQVMQIAIEGAGYSGGEADQLRRDIPATHGWRNRGRLERHRERLLKGFAKRGISQEFGERLYQQITGFSEYGFPESHAASFALLVYASAWLKTHHPAAFACGLLNSQPMGFYNPASIVQDIQRGASFRQKVEVRPVRVESSDWDCTLEPTADRDAQTLRLGFRLLAGFARKSAEKIEAARQQRGRALFDNLEKFVRHTGLRRDELELLAQAGALELLVPQRREAMWRLRAPRVAGLFEQQDIEPGRPAGLPPLRAAEQLALDYATAGLSVSDHPMCHLRKRLGRRRVYRAEQQQHWKKGQQITVAGVIITRQRPKTASGIVFVTLEDETGVVNLVIYPKVFERYELAARHAKVLLAHGRVDRRGQVVHLRVSKLERLDLPSGSSYPLRSRDFH